MAVLRMRSKNTQYNPRYRNTFCRCAVAMRQISRCTVYVSSSMKTQQKAPSNRLNFPIYKEIGVKESNAGVRIFFYRNRLIRRLCACAVKTQLEVVTNAAKSPKYQSLHAKFRTLLILFTITVVDFGTYSHISYFIFNESYKLTIIYCTITAICVQ